jgi:glycine/D-amino acid oxidase-like deaminating enzyme
MFATVDEVQRVIESEEIDCGFQKGGVISIARNKPQAKRQISAVETARSRGFGEDIFRLLEPEEARNHLNATDIHSGIFFSPSATIDPGRLVHGLALAVESRGGKIVEGTTVYSFEEKKVSTSHGEISAEVIIQATEAFTRDLKGKKLDLLPVYSRMIATEPLSDSLMDDIGLADRPTFNDGRYIVIYGQRTEDNRIAFGGQGNPPYLYGSRIDSSIEGNEISHETVWRNLIDLLPQLKDVSITHRWGGVLAIPRNWLPGLRFEKASGLGALGGYVGEGVAAANLAGRTMADLILNLKTDLVSLPWVGVHSRRWEPEPLRWVGVRTSRRFMGSADMTETRTGKTAWLAMKAAHFLRGD